MNCFYSTIANNAEINKLKKHLYARVFFGCWKKKLGRFLPISEFPRFIVRKTNPPLQQQQEQHKREKSRCNNANNNGLAELDFFYDNSVIKILITKITTWKYHLHLMSCFFIHHLSIYRIFFVVVVHFSKVIVERFDLQSTTTPLPPQYDSLTLSHLQHPPRYFWLKLISYN